MFSLGNAWTVRVVTGSKTQTVNIRPPDDPYGSNAYRVRLKSPRFVDEADLAGRGFLDPQALIDVLQRDFGGVVETTATLVTVDGAAANAGTTRSATSGRQTSGSRTSSQRGSARPVIRFNRVVSDAMEEALSVGGVLRPVVERALQPASGLDPQLRVPSVAESALTIYAGLTAVLDIRERGGRFRLSVHATHAAAGSFDAAWGTPRTIEDLAGVVPGVLGYLDRIMRPGVVDFRFSSKEGRVQTMIGTARGQHFAAIQREAVPSFASEPIKAALRAPIIQRILHAMRSAPVREPWWPGVRDRGKDPTLGSELDVLALDSDGRLLAIEIKPPDTVDGIAWAPGQARCYAEMFALWLEVDPHARESIMTMSAQRRRLGLAAPPEWWQLPEQSKIRVVPVVAIGAGAHSPVALDRLALVHSALQQAPALSARLDPLEVWLFFDDDLVPHVSKPGTLTPPPSKHTVVAETAAGDVSYKHAARRVAITWKATTTTLPDDARVAGAYKDWAAVPFCLPPEHNTLNLLPEARQIAIERFAAAQIRWHDGIDGGPSNHLLDSQVNCVNALAPFVDNPEALQRVLVPALPISEILPFGAQPSSDAPVTDWDRSDHVVFEWQGLHDHLNEWRGRPTRGANATSADAAVRYRSNDGAVEIALIEWKFTESYPDGALHGSSTSTATRYQRYQPLFDDPDGPISASRLTLEDLFAEPVYQLARLAMLAKSIERAHEQDCDRVRVLYIAPAANEALWNSPASKAFARHAHHHDGRFDRAWRALLRKPDRFTQLDSLTLTTPGTPTSTEYQARYSVRPIT